MNSRFLLLAVVLLSSAAACRSNPEVAGAGEASAGSGGTGGVDTGGGGSGGDGPGGTGGTACGTASLKRLAGDEAPVRITGFEDGHPERMAGSFPEASPDPVEAARSFLARVGPDVGLSRDGSELAQGPVKHGLAGTYVRFQQLHQGLPVFDREVVVLVAPNGEGSEVRMARFAHARMAEGLAAKPEVGAEAAIEAARGAVRGTPVVADEVVLGFHVGRDAQRLAYRLAVTTTDPDGSFYVFVDALDGAVLETRDLLQRVDGTGLVFDPNPIASTGKSNFYDANDATSPALDAARVRVTLPRLDGSGYLRGDWVDAHPKTASYRAQSPDLVFDFDRSVGGFEETMAYFHLDRVQARLQALGFTDVNNRQITVLVNGSTEENSWYDPLSKNITTGTGGVDDAEDADVLVHEYGHSIQSDQVPGFGAGGDAGGMGEGFGDYLAGSIAAELTAEVLEPECLAEWDGAAFMGGDPPCMRRLDGTKHYPEHLEGEVHADGELWSAVLWQAHLALGADVMDRLVIEAHFGMSRWEKYPAAADAIVETDRALYGGRHLGVLVPLFMERGMLRTPMPPALFPDVLESRAVDVENRRSGSTYRNYEDDTQEIRIPGAAGLRLHFRRIDTERDPSCVGGACDNIYVSDGAGYLFQILNGQAADVTSAVIPGEVAKIRLVTDRGINAFGYAIDRVDVMGFRTCGNGLLDGTETCDGGNLGGATCETLGFAGGALACNADCRLDVTACVAADGCGDGVVGAEEECDGGDLAGATCASLGKGAGRVTCTGACRLDASACSTCGDGIRQGAEACDGTDVGGLSCAGLGLGGGAVACSAACTLDVSACVPDECL